MLDSDLISLVRGKTNVRYDRLKRKSSKIEEKSVLVLNADEEYLGETLPADGNMDLVKSLFDSITSLFLNFKQNLRESYRMKSENEFHFFENELVLLQKATPELLDENKRIAFFLNLYHVLLLHISILKKLPSGWLSRYSII